MNLDKVSIALEFTLSTDIEHLRLYYNLPDGTRLCTARDHSAVEKLTTVISTRVTWQPGERIATASCGKASATLFLDTDRVEVRQGTDNQTLLGVVSLDQTKTETALSWQDGESDSIRVAGFHPESLLSIIGQWRWSCMAWR